MHCTEMFIRTKNVTIHKATKPFITPVSATLAILLYEWILNLEVVWRLPYTSINILYINTNSQFIRLENRRKAVKELSENDLCQYCNHIVYSLNTKRVNS